VSSTAGTGKEMEPPLLIHTVIIIKQLDPVYCLSYILTRPVIFFPIDRGSTECHPRRHPTVLWPG